jgi:hypothetical protein
MAESNIGQDIQAEVLNAIRKSQAAIVDTIERWASTVQAVKPDMPDLPFADSLNFADKLPKPQDLVKNAYDFAEELLASQRKFAEDVLKATAPLIGAGDTAESASKGDAAK